MTADLKTMADLLLIADRAGRDRGLASKAAIKAAGSACEYRHAHSHPDLSRDQQDELRRAYGAAIAAAKGT